MSRIATGLFIHSVILLRVDKPYMHGNYGLHIYIYIYIYSRLTIVSREAKKQAVRISKLVNEICQPSSESD